MKFAKEIETAAHDLPPGWRPYLIHYKALKKAIHHVVAELEARGLSNLNGAELQFSYAFQGSPSDPKPCIEITLEDPTSLGFSGSLTQFIPKNAMANKPLTIRIELIRDSEFFHLLLDGLSQAANLDQSEKHKFAYNVEQLEAHLVVAASPYKKDLYVWREIFKLYLDSNIFNQRNIENDAASAVQSKKDFDEFVNQIVHHKLANKLSSKRSKLAWEQFLAINAKLLEFKRFSSLNQLAIRKILKKHDKRSGLSATAEFPVFAEKHALNTDSMLRSLYASIADRLITIVPQIDSHCCPICFAIVWRPIRLECNHVFCVRCLIKAHRKRLFDCPVCRCKLAVWNADASNLDKSLQNFLQLYFPREIKEKRRENEREQAMMDMEAITGRAWTQHSAQSNCSIM